MPELIARGPEPSQQSRVTLTQGRPCVVGRDLGLALSLPWDKCVSRRHAEAVWRGNILHVRALPGTCNPIYYAGREVAHCEVRPGEHFVLGETCLLLMDASVASAPSEQPIEEVTFSRQSLARVRFRDPDRRIDVLSHLPELIWGSSSDSELHLRLVNLLLAGIMQAEGAAIVAVESGKVRTFHWDRRLEAEGGLSPSTRLVQESLIRQRENVLHIWDQANSASAEFTASVDFDWAFCIPIPGPPNETWGLYVTGRFGGFATEAKATSNELQPDIRFAELVAEIVGAIRRSRQLEREQMGLRQFFPPVILPALATGQGAELLAAREAEVTVMFCDLRGFSRFAEVTRHDLKQLLSRVSEALGVMTQRILEFGGVIGDFQGDSVMGFWGWPVPTPDAPLQACRAALSIRRAFNRAAGSAADPLAPFNVGIGLAHGRAVAGRIGTSEHVKVTVFGLVVNLASRLEGMTKHLHAPVLLDESLATLARARLPGNEGRVRRVAQVLPYGMDTPVFVSELLPGVDEVPELTDMHLAAYEQAVGHFQDGQWEQAYRELRELPASDRVQDFLTAQILQGNRTAPPGWKGVIVLPGK